MSRMLRCLVLLIVCLSAMPTPSAGAAPETASLRNGTRLYQRVSGIYRRLGERAANREFLALSRVERLQVKWSMGQTKLLRVEIKSAPGRRTAARSSSDVSAAAVSCYGTAEDPVEALLTYGIDVPNTDNDVVHFRYHQAIHWCGSPESGITSSGCNAWGDDTNWGFSYEGELEGKRCLLEGGGVGWSYVTYFSQARFELFIIKYGCGPSLTPWIRQTGHSDGRYSHQETL